MDKEAIAKSNQEQAVASWINYLNQVRLERLMDVINSQEQNLAKALSTLDDTFVIIKENIIEKNRGGLTGMHGFVAEIAECGIGNAREQIQGRSAIYTWVNDNGPADLMREGVMIQQKFVASGNHLSLQAIKQHLEKYPWFLGEGGKYQIPEDHYNKIKYLLSLSKEEANKMPTSTGEFSLKQWKEVHEYFAKGDISIDDLEPSKLTYKSVQANKIQETIDQEKRSIESTNKEIRDKAYENSKPTVKEGAKATVVSAVIEGGTTFVLAIRKKQKEGKKITEFTDKDWKEIAKESGVGTLKGGIRGVSIYALTNYTATPAAVASALCTASFGVAEQAHLYRTGKINANQFILNSEMLCLDASVSALSSFVGQALIPVPVIGAVIGNTVGTMMYQITKDTLSKKEQKLIEEYLKSIRELDVKLDKKYKECVLKLNHELENYYYLLDSAFANDYELALQGSVELAISVGVNPDELLKSLEETDKYFME